MDREQQSGQTPPTGGAPVNSHINRHSYITMAGPLIPPSNSLVRQYIMGTQNSGGSDQSANSGRPIQSNLTALLQRHDEEEKQRESQPSQPAGLPNRDVKMLNEADSASGPSFSPRSAPVDVFMAPRNASQPPVTLPPFRQSPSLASSITTSNTAAQERRDPQLVDSSDAKPRRCISSKELGTLAPPSGSPYAYMLYKKEMLEAVMRQRLQERRESVPRSQSSSPPLTTSNMQQYPPAVTNTSDLDSSSGSRSSTPAVVATTMSGMANERRNRRRAEHNQAVISDLCEIVADLFIAEAKLLNPLSYGVVEDERSTVYHPSSSDNQLLSLRRRKVLQAVHVFVSSLPTRYALGVETPSEVLVHMRLMSAVRADDTKAVVHIVNLDEPEKHHHHHYTLTSATSSQANSTTVLTNMDQPAPAPLSTTPPHRKQQQPNQSNRRSIRLVTIACGDADGLLEYITKLLGTGGSRVLDADVMLSRDNIVLDRFVVEMNGRLRLDKLANYIECFLKEYRESQSRQKQPQSQQPSAKACSPEYGELFTSSSFGKPKAEHSPDNKSSSSGSEPSGPLYVPSSTKPDTLTRREKIQEEMETAVPLTTVLASGVPSSIPMRGSLSHPFLRRQNSMPIYPLVSTTGSGESGEVSSATRQQSSPNMTEQEQSNQAQPQEQVTSTSMRQRRPLVNRQATSDLDRIGDSDDDPSMDFVTVSNWDYGDAEGRVIPLIPFEDLMLIETLGTGRVSTIYRAAWRRTTSPSTGGNDRMMWGQTSTANHEYVQMVALKVGMVNPATRDTANVDELRREGDIAARLQHPNICDLVGVAADSECFCLAFDFCEGGSLLSLLSDTSRYYEYLPIALDVANGMAYLHSRNVIHRDLKPSNILLSKDHRAKIADFGMSVNFSGQELTAETGTYRYMAPEVIRHESYSSNADVYSFGICLWQLITREVPFATMTPIQAAYAVAEGRRPEIPESTPRRLQEIITSCWDQDSQKRPSFTYIALALADYAKMAFSPANVGAQTLHIANEMLASVEGNSTVNVDFSTLMPTTTDASAMGGWLFHNSLRYNKSWQHADSQSSDGGNVGLEI